MDDIRLLIAKDIEERELIKAGIKRIKTRQIIQIFVGLLICVMFLINYVQVSRQNKKEDAIILSLGDMLRENKLLIDAQYQLIDTLVQTETPK